MLTPTPTPSTARAVSEVLEELAARCEAASGPDRYIDYDIAFVILPYLTKIPAAEWMYKATGAKHEMFTAMFDDGTRRYSYNAETYTASLDAAMTLVPEGTGVSISRYWIGTQAGPVWSAAIATGGVPTKPGQIFDCYDAATPALALTAAALRSAATIARETEARS